MNNDRIREQIQSLLTRLGYKDFNGDPIEISSEILSACTDSNIYGQIFVFNLSKDLQMSTQDIRRMIEAEPVDRDLGTIELHPQPLTEWGDREDHAEASIVMDARGRDRLIAALIEGRDTIEVYGESGGGYTLGLKVKSDA